MREGREVNHSHGFLIGMVLAIFAAGIGYGVSVLEDHRKREIEFVNQQIEKLYGPLYALQGDASHKERAFQDHGRSRRGADIQ